ncbi:MAG TPA: response regulator transcription factor [Bryobacteraceae bacterium]
MPSDNCKVLIVDDDPAFRRALLTSLAASGFDVAEARTGEEALLVLRDRPCDIVLLDINMPGMGGIETCRRIRNLSPRIGILMVTVRDAEEDKVQALEAGADDFVTKPYRLREMIARLHAVRRRLSPPDEASATVLRAGALTLDSERRLVTKDGAEIHLSPKEYDLLSYLFKHQGALITHSKLLQGVWGAEYGGELEYLRSYVRMLRKKIEDDPSQPEYILTEPWVGYRFRNPADAESPVSDL